MRKEIRITIIGLFSLLLLFGASCSSMQLVTHDQGNHKGWYKNPKNPHHPDSTKATGETQKSVMHKH